MKNRVYFAVYTVLIFFLGTLVGIIFTHQDSELARDNNSLSYTNKNFVPINATTQPINTLPTASTIQAVTPVSTTSTFNTQQFNEQQAKQLINALPDSQLNQYLTRFITNKDAKLIGDKRQFANRAVDELYKNNDSQPLVGQVLLSDSSALPNQSINTTTLQKRQKLYAHLNTFGKVPLGANVFVKWVNRSTGEVLLFEKKLIVPNTESNWVSYQPYESWQPGSYDIRFYQFTSQLEPVAQLSYEVSQIVD